MTQTDTVHLVLLLQRYGKVEDAVVMYDKKTGRSRGFGFITYDNPDVVRKVRMYMTSTAVWNARLEE